MFITKRRAVASAIIAKQSSHWILAVTLWACLGAMTLESYFPASFPQHWHRWYAKHLSAMKEPSLLAQRENTGIESYRFLWLRTFHNPISIRVENRNSGGKLWITRLSVKGGYDPGSVLAQKTIEITATQWEDITNTISSAGFWDMPSEDDNRSSADGAQWILEGLKQGRYHVVDRWSPKEESNNKRALERYVAACVGFLKLADLDLAKEKVY